MMNLSLLNQKLSYKLLVRVFAVVAIAVLLSSYFISDMVENNIRNEAQFKVESQLSFIQDKLASTNSEYLDKVTSGMRLFKKLSLDTGLPNISASEGTPNIYFGTKLQNSNYKIVDDIQQVLGGTATLFVRSGDEFVRVSTNVKKSDGSRAIGTTLSKSGEAYKKISKGESFYGTVDILGKEYLTGYEPVKDKFDKVIGVWYVGYSLDGLSALKDYISSTKILQKGFTALVDDNNVPVFFSDITNEAQVSQFYENGEAYSDWVITIEHFPAWEYKILVAYPQEVVDSEVNASLITVILLGFVVGVILLGVIYFIMNKYVIKPVDTLDEATKKIASGDLDVIVELDSKDEIGNLAGEFNKMTEQIYQQMENLNNLPTPVSVIDKDYNITFINRKGAEVVGKKVDELIGRKCYNHFKTDHCNTEKCACKLAMANNTNVSDETISHANNTQTHVMYTGSPVKNKEGKIIGALEYFADVSEIKEMQNYLYRSTQNMLAGIEQFEQGDLTVKLTAEKEGDDIARLFNGFNDAIHRVKEMINKVGESIDSTASATEEISSSTEQMAAGAHEQSAQAAEVASAVEQMTAGILETTTLIMNAKEHASEAGEIAQNGGSEVMKTIEGINRIAEVVSLASKNIEQLGHSSSQIGDIVQVINDIADQTNLLALNAAIEAARAGEQGRGFAVVADEVRKLAERTTKATQEIGDMIKQIQKDTFEAVESIKTGSGEVEKGKEQANSAGKSLTEIIKAATEVLEVVEQIVTASDEQSKTAEQISQNIDSISSVTQQSAAGTEQVARASGDLSQLMQNLQEQIMLFKTDANEYNNRRLLN